MSFQRVAGKTVQSLVDTVQPKSFGDEYRTHYKALYKCPVYFLYLELKATEPRHCWLVVKLLIMLNSCRTDANGRKIININYVLNHYHVPPRNNW